MKRLSMTFVLLAILLVWRCGVFSTPAIAQNITPTPDIEVIFTTPAPEVAAAPPAVTDVLPAILGIVATVVAGIVTILTGVAVSRNYSDKTRADISRMDAETKRNNDLADADIKKKKAETDALTIQAEADSRRKKAETDNLEAQTRAKIAETDAIKDQLAAEVANTLAKSNAEAFTDMRGSLSVFRTDITNLMRKNDDLLKTVREQNARIDAMLIEFKRIAATDDDGPRDISKAAIDADSAAAAKDKQN